MLSEDLRQIMTGLSLQSETSVDDCETEACFHMGIGNTLNTVRENVMQMGEECVQLSKDLFAGHTDQEMALFRKGIANLATMLAKPVHVSFVTGNAFAPAAGMHTESLCGHQYAHLDVSIKKEGQKQSVKMSCPLEGTKWVDIRRVQSDATMCQLENQVSFVFFFQFHNCFSYTMPRTGFYSTQRNYKNPNDGSHG